MIKEENLTQLYEGMIEKGTLTTKELNTYGFNSKDLKSLIECVLIERCKRGVYQLASENIYFQYGQEAARKDQEEKAEWCFQQCLKLNPHHAEAAFELFQISLYKKDYKGAIKWYQTIQESERNEHIANANFYLLLLGFIIDFVVEEIDPKIIEKVASLDWDKIKIQKDNLRYEDAAAYNRIRSAVVQKKLSYAIHLHNEEIKAKKSATLEDKVLNRLLKEAAMCERSNKQEMLRYVKEKNYEGLLEFLDVKMEQQHSNRVEECLFDLAEQILKIKQTGKVPEATIFATEDIFEAIDGYNYNLALQLDTKYHSQKNISSKDSPLHLLLRDICELIAKQKTMKEENNPKEILSSVIDCLFQDDWEQATNYIRRYTKAKGKGAYEFLILDAIKLSLLDQDTTFQEPMVALMTIENQQTPFAISAYIQKFYTALAQNKIQQATVYYDIIEKLNEVQQEKRLLSGLKEILENTSQLCNIPLEVPTLKPNPTISIPLPKEETTPSSENQEYMKEKHRELIEKRGILLSKPMKEKKAQAICEVAEEYEDMRTMIIPADKTAQVAFRYRPEPKEVLDISALIEKAKTARKEADYETCIATNLQLLEYLENPKEVIYASLGFAYIKTGELNRAIDYLTVANYLAVKEQLDFDFSTLISSLKGEKTPTKALEKNERKLNRRMQQELGQLDYNDALQYYGIENFDAINDQIVASGLDVESACQQMHFEREQIDTIKLIYAREFYQQGLMIEGDRFLRSVEKQKGKSKKTKEIFAEVQTNRNFYQNRSVEKPRQLVFTLNPGKTSKD